MKFHVLKLLCFYEIALVVNIALCAASNKPAKPSKNNLLAIDDVRASSQKVELVFLHIMSKSKHQISTKNSGTADKYVNSPVVVVLMFKVINDF